MELKPGMKVRINQTIGPNAQRLATIIKIDPAYFDCFVVKLDNGNHRTYNKHWLDIVGKSCPMEATNDI
jgi:hypothetical protein